MARNGLKWFEMAGSGWKLPKKRLGNVDIFLEMVGSGC